MSSAQAQSVGDQDAFRTLTEATSSLVWRWTGDDGFIQGEGWDIPDRYAGDQWLTRSIPGPAPEKVWKMAEAP